MSSHIIKYKELLFTSISLILIITGGIWCINNINLVVLKNAIVNFNSKPAIFYTIVLSTITIFLYSLRLQAIIPTISSINSIGITSAGHFANSVLPFRSGEIVRLVLARKIFNLNYSRAIGSTLIERSLDLLSVCILTAVSLIYLNLIPNDFTLIFIAAIVILAIILLIFKKYKRLWQLEFPRWNNIILSTILIWLTTILTFYLFFSYTIPNKTSILDAIALVVVISFALATPSLLASFGTFEAGIVFYLNTKLDVSLEQSLSLALILHFLVTIVPATIFCIFIYLKKKSIR